MINSVVFSKDHIWLEKSGDNWRIGLSSYALQKMRSVVFINLPDIGDELIKGEAFGDVESLKTVSDLISPIDGVVVEINEQLIDCPDELYTDGWLLTVKISNSVDEMMSSDEYEAYIASEDE